uniref:CUB domain-containing protein n=1 Tax=Ascaris lumbricoides TaxID=6252 RepID=A0A9J2PVH6_ASCLU
MRLRLVVYLFLWLVYASVISAASRFFDQQRLCVPRPMHTMLIEYRSTYSGEDKCYYILPFKMKKGSEYTMEEVKTICERYNAEVLIVDNTDDALFFKGTTKFETLLCGAEKFGINKLTNSHICWRYNVISDGESKINKETTADRGKLTTLLLPTIVKTKKDRFEDIELTTAEIPTSHLKPGIVHVDYSSYYLSALKPIKDCKNG